MEATTKNELLEIIAAQTKRIELADQEIKTKQSAVQASMEQIEAAMETDSLKLQAVHDEFNWKLAEAKQLAEAQGERNPAAKGHYVKLVQVPEKMKEDAAKKEELENARREMYEVLKAKLGWSAGGHAVVSTRSTEN